MKRDAHIGREKLLVFSKEQTSVEGTKVLTSLFTSLSRNRSVTKWEDRFKSSLFASRAMFRMCENEEEMKRRMKGRDATNRRKTDWRHLVKHTHTHTHTLTLTLT